MLTIENVAPIKAGVLPGALSSPVPKTVSHLLKELSNVSLITDKQEESRTISKTLDEVSKDSGPQIGTDSPPFLGFVGSQKFPVKPTYKPLPPVEKIDRRHFGLQSKPEKDEDDEEELEGGYNDKDKAPLVPDLPKSPSRDVSYGNGQKLERNEEEETIYNRSLPGASPGLRALGVPSNGSPFEARNETLPGSGAGSRTAGSLRPGIVTFDVNDEDSTVLEKIEDNIYQGPISTSSLSPDDWAPVNRSKINEISYYGLTTTNPSFYNEADKINLTILGLFELTYGTEPRPEGLSELQAARLAVERINQLDKTPRFRIHLAHNDTKVS